MKLPGFIGPTYPSRSVNFRTDRTINWYPELAPDDNGKAVISLIGTPGHSKALVGVGSGPIRGTRVFGGYMWVVSGSELFKLNSALTDTQVTGVMATSTGGVWMSDNGQQIAIVDGVNLYVAALADAAFTTVVLGFAPSSITFLDGYFIVTESGSNRMYVSALYDGLTWPGLATSLVTAAPDNLTGSCAYHQELWLIKDYSIEVWYDNSIAATLGCPFQRMPGVVLDYGTPAPASIVVGAGQVFMLTNVRAGGEGQFAGVMAFQGYTPTPITPTGLVWYMDQLIKEDAFGYMYSEGGHTFYVITFPSSNVTLAYDTTTQMWHERSSWSTGPYTINRHKANSCCTFNGKIYIGDYQSEKIYEMGSSYLTDGGDPIASVRIAPHLSDREQLRNIFIHRLDIDFEAGVGSNGDNPQAEISWSDDGGHTWGNPYPSSMGRKGNYSKNLTWRRLGWTKNRPVRLMISDPVKKVIMNVYGEVST